MNKSIKKINFNTKVSIYSHGDSSYNESYENISLKRALLINPFKDKRFKKFVENGYDLFTIEKSSVNGVFFSEDYFTFRREDEKWKYLFVNPMNKEELNFSTFRDNNFKIGWKLSSKNLIIKQIP